MTTRAEGAAASPTLAKALDACFEPVAGWQSGEAPRRPDASPRHGRALRLTSPRQLVLLALDELELFARKVLWSQQRSFVLARRAFGILVATSIVVAVDVLFVSHR